MLQLYVVVIVFSNNFMQLVDPYILGYNQNESEIHSSRYKLWKQINETGGIPSDTKVSIIIKQYT